jgi:hypothetical protein
MKIGTGIPCLHRLRNTTIHSRDFIREAVLKHIQSNPHTYDLHAVYLIQLEAGDAFAYWLPLYLNN